MPGNMALKLNRKKIGRNVALFVCLCGLLGAIEFFLPASLALYSLQTKASKDNVSGEIIVVGIDSQSIKAVGRWPWSRETQAQLLRAIDEYNPKSIYVDIGYQGRTTANADSALREAISNTKAPTTVIALATTDGDGDVQTIYSHPAAVGTAPFVTAHSPYLFGYIWSLPTTLKAPRGQLQSVAANIAGRPVPENTNFRVNYSLNPDSIPIYRAKDIMTKAVDPSKLAGKTVILGVTDKTQNDVHSMPAWGERPGVAFHVLGAETLKRGYPIEAGWIPFFLLATAVCVALLTAKGLHYSTHITIACSILILVISTFLTTQHIGNDPFPSILLLVISGVYIARQKAALLRSQRDPKTGLSDMTGYMVDEVMANTWFVGATPLVATSLRSYIAPEDEIQIAKEIAKRLSTIIDERQLAHNGNQQFLWEMPPIATGELAAHLEG
ncbi:MAG: CHASE2 domain-containing protein, partial [Candidatus Moraniibacteriota bacterium]